MSVADSSAESMSLHLFGIRHHGVGSSRSVLAALEHVQPDCILIEAPADAESLIPLVGQEAMQPPVAMLMYNTEQPQQAAWYPFTAYSPEWVALRYALARGIPVRFIDLPQRHMLAFTFHPPHEDDETQTTLPAGEPILVPEAVQPEEAEGVDAAEEAQHLIDDPIGVLAKLAGEQDGERWWSRVVEEAAHTDSAPEAIFDVLADAMTLLREAYPTVEPQLQHREQLREAWMRKIVHTAMREFKRVAVVCGAWHVPALRVLDDRSAAKRALRDDAPLLKGLPAVKVTATFSPWTYSRIAREAGYGAGIPSPGWYHHLWETPSDQVAARWLAKVAALLRGEGLLASTAQVIDSLRLAETLASLREHPTVGLDELNEASVSVLCAGNHEPMALIRKRLIIGERMGQTPPETPTVPLQRDLEAEQRRLRLKLSVDEILLDLDLRDATGLARSHLLHRLSLLHIPWGVQAEGQVQSRGTFHEFWKLRWSPELLIRVIEASIWGSTVEGAAGAFVIDEVNGTDQLDQVSALIRRVLLAELPTAAEAALLRLQDLAALTHDVQQLMRAVPPLVNTLRYGDVRQTNREMIASVVEALAARISVGIGMVGVNSDDDGAAALVGDMKTMHDALVLLQNSDLLAQWLDALVPFTRTAGVQTGVHARVAGTAAQLLRRANRLSADAVARLMRLTFSTANDPAQAAAWLEGFLSGMQEALLRDPALFALLDGWVVSLEAERFTAILPLLRRTFSTFTPPARRDLLHQVRVGERRKEVVLLHAERAARVLPLIRQILEMPADATC